MKTLTKKTKQKTQRKTSKNIPVQPKSKVSAANAVEFEEAEQLSGYDSYYKQLSEEVESIERHVRELRQTPGLEYLTEEQAQEKVDFMLRFSAWVYNQQQQEQQIASTMTDAEGLAEITPTPAKVSKVQKTKGVSNKKVTIFLTR